MSSRKSILLVGVIAVAHFAMTSCVVVARLACEGRPGCSTARSGVFGEILGLPLGIVSRLLGWLGYEPNGLARHVPGGLFVLLVLNSVLAAVTVWLVAGKVWRRRREARRAAGL